MLNNRLKRLEELVNITHQIQVKIENEVVKTTDLAKTAPIYRKSYVPAVSAALKENMETAIIIGPYGSGKTSAIVNAIMMRMLTIPPCDDGIRRYRCVIIRNTSSDLESTVLNTWNFWAQNFPSPHRNKRPFMLYTYRIWDEKGLIEAEIMFLALDREEDYRKLASLEATDIYFNELQFITKSIFDHAHQRINRYPAKTLFDKQYNAKKDGKYTKWQPYKSYIFCDTNPPEEDHWISKLEEKINNNKIKGMKVYHQPPALIEDENGIYKINSKADNLAFVGEKYYLNMLNNGREYIRVYGQGKYGLVTSGKQVYPNYNDDLHSMYNMHIDAEYGVIMGWDYGEICPACLLAQEHDGRLFVFKEFIGDRMTVTELFKTAVLPFLNKYFRDQVIECVGDPANTYHGQEQLEECGIDAEPAVTNNPEVRISAVRDLLGNLVGGKAQLCIAREGCPELRKGFTSKYHYKRLRVLGDERYRDVPEKNHPYSDIHDALQYIVLHIFGMPAINDNDEESQYEAYMSKNKLLNDDRSDITGY